MKVIESYIDTWFNTLVEALPEKYKNIFLGSYCFAVKDEDRTRGEDGKLANLTYDNLKLLNKILETDSIKVSKTREFNKEYCPSDYVGKETDVNKAFDNYMREKTEEAVAIAKIKQKQRAGADTKSVAIPNNKYYLFPDELSYEDYLIYSPDPIEPYLSDVEKIYALPVTQSKLDRGIKKYKDALKQFKETGRFVSFSANLAGHTLRQKWKYGIMVDLKHLARGDINIPSSPWNINLYDTLYIVDHADLMKFQLLEKRPISRDAVQPCSITFSGTAKAGISLAAYHEFEQFLDIYSQQDPELKFDQNNNHIKFAYQAGPTLKTFQIIMGDDTDLMQDLLNPVDKRTDSPHDEKELRYWLSAIDASDTLNLHGNIVGILLPNNDKDLRAAWVGDDAPPEVIEQVTKLKAKVRADQLAVCWSAGGEIVEIENAGLIPSALKQYMLELKNNL